MGDNRSPDDANLSWPVARGDLDELETLELGRDATGRLNWQNMTPPRPNTYRAWLPRRGKATAPATATPPDDVADVWLDDPLASLFASEATPNAAQAAAQRLEAPGAPPLEDWGPELPLKARLASTAAAATPPPPPSPPLPFWSTTVAAPLRLSLAIAPIEGRRPVRISLLPPPGQARTRVERLALLGAGALIGVVASMVFIVASRPHERPASSATLRPSPAPLALALVPLATPVLPGKPLANVDVPAVRRAPTEIAPVRTSPRVHVGAAAAPSRQAVAHPRRSARAAGATQTAARPAESAAAPTATPPEVLATVGRFAAAYNRMDASATQAVWPSADHQALVTTFTALREQRLTLSRCRGTRQGDTATVLCRGTLRYRPRVGNHDTQVVEGTWRFTMLQRADDWVVDGVQPP